LFLEKENLSMSRFTTCGLMILLAFAPAALAVDGTVLINQSTITNGLTGCPTGGHLPILICQSGSYRLSGNVTVPDAITNAIEIRADNVTVDLNGFSIIGPVLCLGGPPVTSCSPPSASGGGLGITSGFDNITISNGTIRGTGFDAIVLSGTGNRVANVNAYSNANVGIAVNNGIVTSCTATNNGGAGIEVVHSIVSGSIAMGNLGVGIALDSSSTVFDNVATQNGFSGISGPGTLRGNTTSQNGRSGIFAVCPSLVSENLATGNSTGNINTSGSGCTVVNNSAP
jgi:hypothetical protein